MDARVGVRAYVEDLLSGAWGGGIELAVLAQMKKARSSGSIRALSPPL